MKIFSVAALGFLGLSLIATPALAVKSATGLTISDITIIGTDRARIAISSLSGTTGGSAPGCSVAATLFAIDLTSQKGRALLNLATAAVLAGKTVNITGGNGCIAVDNATSLIQTLDQLTLNP